MIQARPDDRALLQLARDHEPLWWQPLTGRRVQLARRGPSDLQFIRSCWADADFMARFNRTAPPLPAHEAETLELLRREQASIVSESKALHWSISSKSGTIGLLSVVNLNLAHRRGELLIGLRGDHGVWDGAEAAHLAFGFLARKAGVERLTAYFYPDNQIALRSALKLGFQHEGVLRGYLRAKEAGRQDLHVAGLLLDSTFFQQSAKVRCRLLGPDQHANDESVAGRLPQPRPA